MNMYAAPVDGTYQHKMPNFDGTFRSQQVKVLVLGESEKQYLIRLTLPVGNHRQYDQIKVRKHNVRLKRATEEKVYDYSDAYWND